MVPTNFVVAPAKAPTNFAVAPAKAPTMAPTNFARAPTRSSNHAMHAEETRHFGEEACEAPIWGFLVQKLLGTIAGTIWGT